MDKGPKLAALVHILVNEVAGMPSRSGDFFYRRRDAVPI